MTKRTPTFNNKAMDNLANAIFNQETITAISDLIEAVGINTLNRINSQGNNILHIAAQFHPNEIITAMILPSITNPDATNNDGHTALDIATQYFHTHVADEINFYMNNNIGFELDLNNPSYPYFNRELCGLCMRNAPAIADSDIYTYDQ